MPGVVQIVRRLSTESSRSIAPEGTVEESSSSQRCFSAPLFRLATRARERVEQSNI